MTDTNAARPRGRTIRLHSSVLPPYCCASTIGHQSFPDTDGDTLTCTTCASTLRFHDGAWSRTEAHQ